MAGKPTREEQRQRKVNTRDALAAAQEYCDRHGFCMPLEFLLAVGNGKDPRTGTDVFIDPEDMGGSIRIGDSTRAMAEAAKYIYIPASKVEIAGDLGVQIAPIQVDKDVVDSLASKLHSMGIGMGATEK